MEEFFELLTLGEERVYKRKILDTVLSFGDLAVLMNVIVLDIGVLGCGHSLVHRAECDLEQYPLAVSPLHSRLHSVQCLPFFGLINVLPVLLECNKQP